MRVCFLQILISWDFINERPLWHIPWRMEYLCLPMLVVQSWTIPCLCTSCFQSQILQDLSIWVCVVVCRKLGPVLMSWLLYFQEFCELLFKHSHCSNSVQSTHNYITFIKNIGSKYSKPITFLLVYYNISLFKNILWYLFLKFTYLFLATLGLHCWTNTLSSCRAWSSHYGDLSYCRAPALELRLNSCGSWA